MSAGSTPHRRRRLDRTTVEMLTGAVVLAILVVFLSWAYRVDDTGGGSMRLSARFNQIDGLAIGGEVRMAGLVVGTVTAQSYNPDTHEAVVAMVVDPDLVLPDDSSVAIVSDGLLGGKYVTIEPGGSFDNLADGDEFTYTQDAVIFERILERIITRAEARREAARKQ